MELRQLEYFVAVARQRHFRRASEEVYVTQSALSQQIQRLEAELGLQLLIRTPKGAELTPAGREFLEHAEVILREIAAARAAIDEHLGLVRGAVRVAATVADSQGLAEALLSFHHLHPAIHIALRHASAAEVVELVSSGVADVGITGRSNSGPSPGSALDQHVIRDEPLCLICAPDHPLAGSRDVTIDELRGAAVILPQRGAPLRELVTGLCSMAGFTPLPLFEVSDPHTIRFLAHSGLGLSAVPVSLVDGDGPPLGVATFAEPVPRHQVILIAKAPGIAATGSLVADHLRRFFAKNR